MKIAILLAAAMLTATAPAAVAQANVQAGAVVTPAMLAAIIRLPVRNGPPTYEDLLAALSRPIRFYDANGDGLSRSEIDSIAAAKAQSLRVGTVSQILRYDLDGDRTVTSAEYAAVTRIGQGTNGDGGQRQFFDRADLNHDGSVTLDEMLTLQPDQQRMVDRDAAPIASVTVAADPTPESNFTLADARSVIDALFARYDTDSNGLLDQTELRAAHPTD